MTSPSPVEVKVVYSAPGAKRRRLHRSSLGSTRTPSRTIAWALLGLTNLAVAGTIYYATWWEVDVFFYMTAIMKTPIPGLDLDAAAEMFGVPGSQRERRDLGTVKKPQPTQPGISEADSTGGGIIRPSNQSAGAAQNASKHSKPPRFTAETTVIVIGSVMYGWLALSTLSYGLLALTAGVALARAGLHQWQRLWIILTTGLVLLLAWTCYDVLSQYGNQYPVGHLRMGMGGFIGLGLLLGLAISVGLRVFMSTGGASIILAATGSMIGLYLLGQCDAVEARYAALPFIALVWLAHSAYGWLLLFIATRMARRGRA